MKPIIGIVGRPDETIDNFNIICTPDSVREAVIEKGGNAILILPPQKVIYEETRPKDTPKLTTDEKKMLTNIIDMCDGIIIPGGTKTYEYDRFIYECSLKKDIPILGICAGMQLIGMVDSKDKIVLKENGTKRNHYQKKVKEVHSVIIKPGTKLHDIVGKESIMVNSRHNYSIKETTNLTINCYSDDGLIEGFEYSNKRFVIGVQWHPENMLEYSDSANKIFEAFISECKIVK